MACFADVNVSQGSVATYARCGGILNFHLTTNSRKNLPVKIFSIDSGLTELWPWVCGPAFLAHPVGLHISLISCHSQMWFKYVHVQQIIIVYMLQTTDEIEARLYSQGQPAADSNCWSGR